MRAVSVDQPKQTGDNLPSDSSLFHRMLSSLKLRMEAGLRIRQTCFIHRGILDMNLLRSVQAAV